ncbi:ATP-binding protein [Pseudomonas sp. LD120]|uniref:ATP-binding protein n=1 Tax=Pseudomonas sp. LD120 TaxID=485751 RepID=UPI003531A6AE
MGNAAKYPPTQGRVTLSVTTQGHVVQLTLSDNGIGIPAKALLFIFKLFRTTRRPASTAPA